MLFNDTYLTIASRGSGEIKERGSRFLSIVFPVVSEADFKISLQKIKAEHDKAAHHCWAYIVGFSQEIQKFSDDREPSNTAGRPILRSILANGLTNTGIIVVRYFGGKLLGVPGLIKAYEDAANAAIQSSVIESRMIMEMYRLQCAFGKEKDAFRIIKQFGLKVLKHEQEKEISIIFEVRKSEADKVIKAIKELHHLNISYYATK